MTSRRGFIQGLLGLVVAPVLVKAMPPVVENELVDEAISLLPGGITYSPHMVVRTGLPSATWRLLNEAPLNFRGIPIRVVEDLKL